MPNLIDASGITVMTQAELIAQKTADYLSIYGVDLSALPSDNPDVQKMMVEVQAILDQQDLVVAAYNSMDPDKAIGTALDARLAYNGIQRQGGTYTFTNVTVVVQDNITLPGLDQTNLPFAVADQQGNQWFLVATQNPTGTKAANGTYSYQFRAQFPGAVLTTPNTIIVPITIILGVVSVNNPTTYTTLGLNEESYARARLRRQAAVALPSQGFESALQSALENIAGIISTSVHENEDPGVDYAGVPGNSIWVIVNGAPAVPPATAYDPAVTYAYGALASSGGVNYISWQDGNVGNSVANPIYWGIYDPIAMTIYQKRNSGCGMYGGISYTITKRNGEQLVVKYSIVAQQNLYIQFTATSLNGKVLPNAAAILANIESLFVPTVDQEVNINDLATYVRQIDPNCLVTNAGFSLSGAGPWTPVLLPSTIAQQFLVDSSRIAITVTPL